MILTRRFFLRLAPAVTVAILFMVPDTEAAKPPRRLQVTVSATAIGVTNASDDGRVVLVGYELADFMNAPLYRRVYRERQADRKGAVDFDLGRAPVAASFWVAFDVETGAYGVSPGTRGQLREAELPATAFRRDSAGRAKHVEARIDYVYSLVIRPGTGVWEATAGDGAEGDDDGKLNGRINVAASTHRRRPQTNADLAQYESGDVVAVFLPHQMAYFITQVTP